MVDASQTQLTRSERWYLDSFRKFTSPECAGFAANEFWQQLVHQATQVQPAVRHAVIAISAMHWQFAQATPGMAAERSYLDPHYALALRQCNKAMAFLRQDLKKTDFTTRTAGIETALITCVVLVSLALFQQDTEAAFCNLHSGYTLLEKWHQMGFNGNSSGPILLRAFADLHVHQVSFENPEHWVTRKQKSLGELVTSNQSICKFIDAYQRGSDLLAMLGWVIQANCPPELSTKLTGAFAEEVARVKLVHESDDAVPNRMHLWKGYLRDFMRRYEDKLPPRHRESLAVIEMWTEVMLVQIRVIESPAQREMVYDGCIWEFRRIVELGKIFLDADLPAPQFTAKLMIIPPLFLCAQKCRDWDTRQEVLHLLRSCRRREGILSSLGAAGMIQRLIEVESEGIMLGETIPPSRRIDQIRVDFLSDSCLIRLRYHRPPADGGHCDDASSNDGWESVVVPN
ncbi:uncharacterized protein N7459_002371 [Penicillium hispanicum]|uniref:uncharacterized protein n=1 Tax=Penicillium hispanicum TaxID=1080232 RepID=UPI0025416CB1|nr:uncharacterized protein N7459_002371 [Penicillium hispanicum]KAJ5592002.1 hypothetical protein N7459_002371 [Penicillium hispanicum]